MKTITLSEPWTYRIPTTTIDFAAGAHKVSDDIHAAAIAAGAHKEEEHGSGSAKDRSARAADKAEG